MYQRIDFSIERLSAPVEELNINLRSYRSLKRARIHTVAEIIIAGRSYLLAAKNIGPLTTGRIFSAVAGHLGVPEELLSSEEVKQLASSRQSKPVDPLEASVTALDLPSSTIDYLKSLSVSQIRELLKLRTRGYEGLLGLEETDKSEIDSELSSYLVENEQTALQSMVETYPTMEPPIIDPPRNNDLGLVFEELRISERAWSVLQLRAMQSLKFGEIGATIGSLSRQRTHQIFQAVQEKVLRKLHLLCVFLDYFENRSQAIRERLGDGQLELKTLAHALVSDSARSFFMADEKEIEKMIVLIRTLAMHQKPGLLEQIERRWKSFIFLCCFVDPPMENNEAVRQIMEKQRDEKKRKTHKDLAYLVLAQAKKPMHWSEIAQQVYNLGGHDSFRPLSLYETIRYHKELFVRVGAGMYELLEWGNKPVELYTNIIASILREEKRPLPLDLIFAKVSAIRPMKRLSLIMSLSMHPRFYKSINATYGLRGWLPPQEKQNPGTPEWLLEDPQSFKRMERANVKGYALEKIIVDDLLP